MIMQVTTTPSNASARVHRPGATLPAANPSGHPGRLTAGFPSSHRSWKDADMAASKPKPEPVEDEREQARRALQTSMDTRQ
jgi:hypothetical protein